MLDLQLALVADRIPSTQATKEKISSSKKGIKQSPEHLAARKAGRRPKFEPGDDVYWFGEQGQVLRNLGISSAYGDGRQAIWYEVAFGYSTRHLVQDVLSHI